MILTLVASCNFTGWKTYTGKDEFCTVRVDNYPNYTVININTAHGNLSHATTANWIGLKVAQSEDFLVLEDEKYALAVTRFFSRDARPFTLILERKPTKLEKALK
jgi:hypothetical protein